MKENLVETLAVSREEAQGIASGQTLSDMKSDLMSALSDRVK